MKVCVDKVCEGVLCDDCKELKPSICGKRGLIIPSGGCGSVYFTGVEDVETNQGECIDLENGVRAYDGNGHEIPFTVLPTEIPCCDIGEYEVTYMATGVGNKMLPSMCIGKLALHVTDCGSASDTIKRKITVLPTPLKVCEGKVCCSVAWCADDSSIVCQAKVCDAKVACS